MIEFELRETGFVRSYKDVPKGAQIISVNGRDVLGICVYCDTPVLDGQKYCSDEEGEIAHDDCHSEIEEKEFLIDSGEL